MSNEEFFGRPTTGSIENIQFDLCEVCQRRSPNWLEIRYQDNLPIVRFTCHECHQIYIDSSDVQGSIVTRDFNPDEEIQEVTRQGWIDDFIKEGGSVIEKIGDEPKEDESSELADSSQVEYAEAPESFQEGGENFELQEQERVQIAVWAPKFIEQSLFGPNPEQWLKEQHAFDKDQHQITIVTLGNFASNDITSVKLSAIQCLLGLYNTEKSLKNEVLQQLSKFQIDTDETVANFATDSINQIK